MAKPTSMKDVVDLVRRSQVVETGRLDSYFDDLKRENTKSLTPVGLLDRLLVDRLITKFQYDLLAQGKWKGFSLGNYRILDRIAAGGMGQVFIGEHTKLGKKVAIKVLAANLTDNAIARQRFVREARAAAALSHENIVQVFDVNTDSNPPYIVMEYVDGTSLQAAVALSGPLAPGAAAICGHQIALGLQHAFEHQLVHRDIKPANVVIDRKGICKLLDLGIARFDDGQELTRVAPQDKLILGTVEYLAPEQAIDSTKVDTRADIYSLGATLYFLLTGAPPFAKAAASAKLLLKQTEMPPMVTDLRPDVPIGLAAVIHRMLAVKPLGRYLSPAAVADALAEFAVPPAGFPDSLFARVPPRFADSTSTPIPAKSSANSDVVRRYATTPPPVDRTAARASRPSDRAIPAVVDAGPAAFDFSELRLDPDDPSTVADVAMATPAPAQPSSPGRRSSHLPTAAPKPASRKRLILLGGLAAGVALIGVLLLTIVWLTSPPAKPVETARPRVVREPAKPADGISIPESTATTLIVARTGKFGHYPTVMAALQNAGPSVQRVEVWDDTTEEILATNAITLPPKLTIVGKGPTSGRTTVTVPRNSSKTDWVHALHAANGVTLENLTFDGGGSSAYLLFCTGQEIVLKNVAVQNFTAIGTAALKVNGFTATGCRFAPSGLAAESLLQFHTSAQRVIVHDCRFDGEATMGIHDHGLLDAQIVGNRFSGLTHAIRLREIPTAGRGIVLRQNVVSQCDEGLRIDKPPAIGPTLAPRMLELDGNHFHDVTKATWTPGLRLAPVEGDLRKIWVEAYDASGWNKKHARFFRGTFDAPDAKAGGRKILLDGVSHAALRVWVNGAAVSNWMRGHQSVYSLDITKYAKPGTNAIAVAVAPGPPSSPTAPEIEIGVVDDAAAPANGKRPFLLLRVRDMATGTVLIKSDAKSWRCGRTSNPLWCMPDFDDSTWTAPWEVVNAMGQPEPMAEVWASEIHDQFPGVGARFRDINNIYSGKSPLGGFPNLVLTEIHVGPFTNPKDPATYLRLPRESLPPALAGKAGQAIDQTISLPTMPPLPPTPPAAAN
jgi:serine/threonine-protein kinase